MTETNTQRGWEERFSGQFLDGDDIRDCGKCMILVDEEFIDFFATELTKAREEGRNQEKTEVSEACKRLAGLADFNHVSDEMRSSATLYLLRSAEEDKSKYIKFLQEQPEQAIQSYRQELRKKVEGMLDPYPEGLFHPVSTEDIDRVADFCKGAGFSIDRLSAYMYRRARKTMKEDLLTIISE